MTAPCLHVYVKVHSAATHDLGVVLLPGLGGNGLCFPKPFVAGVLQAVEATMGIAVTYGLPVPRAMDGVAKAVWEALWHSAWLTWRLRACLTAVLWQGLSC
jgi:hypothetical protein